MPLVARREPHDHRHDRLRAGFVGPAQVGLLQVDVAWRRSSTASGVAVGSDTETVVLDPTGRPTTRCTSRSSRTARSRAPTSAASTCACTSTGRTCSAASSRTPASRGRRPELHGERQPLGAALARRPVLREPDPGAPRATDRAGASRSRRRRSASTRSTPSRRRASTPRRRVPDLHRHQVGGRG